MTRTPARFLVTLGAASAIAFSLTMAVHAAPDDDVQRRLRHKDPVVRLAVVDDAVRAGGKEAEAILLLALSNDDWEVVERAAAGLATRGTAKTAPRLVALSVDGPIRRIRLAAARSAAKLDVDATVRLLGKAALGDGAVRAYEALAAIGESGPNGPAALLVDRGIDPSQKRASDKTGPVIRDSVRAAAASALGAFGRVDLKDRLARLLRDDDPAVACAALDATASAPDIAVLGVLVGSPTSSEGRECVERRVRTAIRAAIAGRPRGTDAVVAAKPVFDALKAATSPDDAKRFVRIVAALAEADASDPDVESPAADMVDAAVQAITSALSHPDAAVRSAAASALGRIGSPATTAALARLADADPDAHVRLVGVHALARCAKSRDPDAIAAYSSRLADSDPRVREEAAVALGIEFEPDAVAPLAKSLAKALADPAQPDWVLATAALVSLGRTHQPAAAEALREGLRFAGDWRVRASAAAGIARLRLPECVPDLVEALADKAPCVRATALATLVSVGGKDVGVDVKSWRAWWKAKEQGFFFPDHGAALREYKMYGWAETAAGVYEDLDVVLLGGSSGDDDAHEVLDLHRIKYRECRPGQLAAAGVHPSALVIGFTNDAADADAEVIEWFVHAGGLLAAGGPRLEHILRANMPGCVRAAGDADSRTPGAIVPVAPCLPWSHATAGAFDGAARPVRRGAPRSFVEVLDPDLVEVSIDSPVAAAAFGSADFACWLRCGHGTAVELGCGIDVSGVEYFAGARNADDRAAIAVDRMGVDYAEVRKLRERKVFDSAARCATEVVDLSSFRFVTNFVREKRRAED